MNFGVRPMRAADIERCLTLWQESDGVVLRASSDQPEAILAFLERNPGLSWVAETSQGMLVAALLCGHDGRRAYLYHLAVRTEWRQLGCGRAMVNAALERLKLAGIPRCHAFVSMENEVGKRFWEELGAETREDVALFTLRL
jgi:ribosomal protein S18 acetylase RimI-like enzyme